MNTIGHWVYNLLCPTTPEKASAFWTAIQGIGTGIAAIGAIFAAYFTYKTVKAQMKQLRLQSAQLKAQLRQTKIELWRSLSHEFDHDLAEARSRCAENYLLAGQANLDIFMPIMDFFDTIGYLVRNHRIDQKLAHDTFHYYFTGYLWATENILKEERKKNISFYSEVFYLLSIWGKEPTIKDENDLKGFFDQEGLRAARTDDQNRKQ